MARPNTLSHFLIGIPGSGKSTLAQWLHQQTGGIIISTDQVRSDLYGDSSIQGDWSDIEAEVMQQIWAAYMQQKTVIYDATNAKQAWRQDFLRQTSFLKWLAWYINIPWEICLARNQRRLRQVSPTIIQAMAKDLQQAPPQVDDGFADVIVLDATDRQSLKALKIQHLQYLGG